MDISRRFLQCSRIFDERIGDSFVLTSFVDGDGVVWMLFEENFSAWSGDSNRSRGILHDPDKSSDSI